MNTCEDGFLRLGHGYGMVRETVIQLIPEESLLIEEDVKRAVETYQQTATNIENSIENSMTSKYYM